MASVLETGAWEAAGLAFAGARMALADIDYLTIYDSFTTTLAMLLEELGVAPRGGAAARARRGRFEQDACRR